MDKFIRKIISVMPKPIQKLWYSHESIWMYIIVGGLTTIVSFIFQYIPAYIFSKVHMAGALNTFLSTTISWIFSVTFAFFTNKKYVFRSITHTKSDFWKEFGDFYGGRLVTYFLELGIMEVGANLIVRTNKGWKYLCVKLFAQIIILIINYVFSKFVVFRKRSHEKK